MTPRNLHIECNPNETPLNAIRRALKNLRIGHTASIESFTLSTGESLPPGIVDDLINMSSSKRVYMTWTEQTAWGIRLHVLYAEDVDQENEDA